jgi:type VI secretion system protein ImpA
MPTSALIEIDALLEPIPGDNPAGKAVPFAVRETLDKARKEIDPSSFANDDPMRPKDFVRADWGLVVETAQSVLTDTSKDMLTAARLTEALVKSHQEDLQGFGALRDGLRLMRRMLAECWDRLHPPIEEPGDEEIRGAPIAWLDDPNRGARFPLSIRTTALVRWGDQALGWQKWRDSTQAVENAEELKEAFEKAVAETPRSACQDVADDLGECLAELGELDHALEQNLASYAPAISSLKQAVYDCHVLAKHILDKKGPEAVDLAAPDEGEPVAEAGDGEPVAAGSGGRRALNSRADIYRTIGEAAAALRNIEPHSPIPYLLDRAVELGALPFPELMKVLVRNPDVLSMMSRELGIRGMAEE